MKNIRIIMKHFSNFTLSVFLFLMAQFSSAAIVDGIKTAADGYTDSRVLQWYNDHHSIYNVGDNLTNQMFYAYDSGELSMFIEVPSYAKNMIWADDKNDLDATYVGYYEDGTHHNSWNSSYGTAVDSEFFRLNGTGSLSMFSEDLCFGLTDDGGNCDTSNPYANPNPADTVYWQTSLDWLLGAGSAECGDIAGSGANDVTENCAAYDRTMSLEIVIDGLASAADGQSIVDSISTLRLHLSDEMVGLPITQVPVPPAAWLFSSALLGLTIVRKSHRAQRLKITSVIRKINND